MTVLVTDGTLTTIWLAAVGLAVLVGVPVAAGPGTRAVLLSVAALSVVASLASTEVEWLWVPGALVLAAGYLGAAVATRRWMVGWVGVGIAGVGLLGYLAVVPRLLDPELSVLDEPLGIRELVASAAGLAVVWLAARLIVTLRPGGLGRIWPFVFWAAGLVLITGVTVSAGVMIGAAVRQPRIRIPRRPCRRHADLDGRRRLAADVAPSRRAPGPAAGHGHRRRRGRQAAALRPRRAGRGLPGRGLRGRRRRPARRRHALSTNPDERLNTAPKGCPRSPAKA